MSDTADLRAAFTERLAEAEEEARESHGAAMNSYGAGYDRGYADALRWVLDELAAGQ